MASEFLDVIPVLPYADIRAAHDFLVEVVGLASTACAIPKATTGTSPHRPEESLVAALVGTFASTSVSAPGARW
jgi:hypothetical protein